MYFFTAASEPTTVIVASDPCTAASAAVAESVDGFVVLDFSDDELQLAAKTANASMLSASATRRVRRVRRPG